ncbi:MAG: Zn-ribbon domain-containing OB-fold protein [Thermodesulfobacteriota bacterium]
MEQKKELLVIGSGQAEQPFQWSIGRYGSKFLAELRDNKRIVGIRCPRCQKVFVPPRRVCGECFVAMDEIVPLSGEGTIQTFTVLSFGFVDPDTGRQKPVPYTWAFIKLDGSDNTFIHYVEETDLNKLKIGLRVRAVFEEDRHGHLLDIKHFETIPEN